MNINRNNYEEYLLLYIDGELLPEIEKEVEHFLESNQDIRQELDSLLNTKIIADNVSFGDVAALLKTEGGGINLKNYQEHFLLFVDNELNNQQQQATETFVLQHPNLQQDFLALQQTKLSIETIECPNKEKLYRRERKPIVFYFQRMATAAVFIGLIAFIWNINTAKPTTEFAKVSSTKNENIPVTSSTNSTVEKVTIKENTVAANRKYIAKKAEVIVVKNNTPKLEKNIVEVVTKNAALPLSNHNVVNQNIQKQNNDNSTNTLATNNQIQNNNTNNNISNNNAATATINTNLIANNNPAIRQVIYKSLDADDDNNKSTLTAAGDEIKTSKLIGLFKKAMKAITPKDNDDNNSRKLFAVTL
jgi:hypothetical protein